MIPTLGSASLLFISAARGIHCSLLGSTRNPQRKEDSEQEGLSVEWPVKLKFGFEAENSVMYCVYSLDAWIQTWIHSYFTT